MDPAVCPSRRGPCSSQGRGRAAAGTQCMEHRQEQRGCPTLVDQLMERRQRERVRTWQVLAGPATALSRVQTQGSCPRQVMAALSRDSAPATAPSPPRPSPCHSLSRCHTAKRIKHMLSLTVCQEQVGEPGLRSTWVNLRGIPGQAGEAQLSPEDPGEHRNLQMSKPLGESGTWGWHSVSIG